MLPGLTWLGPFAVKLLCPQTALAVRAPTGIRKTRLFAASAIYTLPLLSSFTSEGEESVLGDACGATLVLAVMVTKSAWPKAVVAGADAGLSGNTITRLSVGTETYRF